MNARAWCSLTLGLLLALGVVIFGIGSAPAAHAQAGAAQPGPVQPAAAAPTFTPTPTPAPPPPPVLVAPANGALTTGTTHGPLGMPTFRWQLPNFATISHIQVSNSPGFSTILVDTDTYATTYTPTGVWLDGDYYWRVKAGVTVQYNTLWGPYSEPISFKKKWEDGPTTRPTLLLPADQATRRSYSEGDFSWSAVPGAAGYTLEISRNAQFSDVVYRADSGKPQHTPNERLAGGMYYWRVTPFAYYSGVSQRVAGAPSDVHSFRIDWSAPPQLLSPPANYATAFVPRFQWQAVEGAKTYELQVSSDAGFGGSTCTPPTCNSYATSSTDYSPTNSQANDTDYYWRVRALDAKGNPTNWSDVRLFRMQWDFVPKLLTPLNNEFQLSYPFFSWEPVPGAEQYQIQIDDSNRFEQPLIGEKYLFNVTSYTQPSWQTVPLQQSFFWRVRALNAAGSYSPWSEVWAFQSGTSVAPNYIYPPQTYDPDAANVPVHKVTSIAWPLFIWDTAHMWQQAFKGISLGPDRYVLEVDDSDSFSSPEFSMQTRTLGAAPVFDAAHPEWRFSNLQNGVVYYWRVRAFRGAQQLGQSKSWQMRYDRAASDLVAGSVSAPTMPRDGFEAVAAPPVLGWQPVVIGGGDARNYHVQISRTADFAAIVDEAYPQFVNYVPWQGRPTEMPFGTYWWRVRAESSPGAALTDWSAPRHFNLSTALVSGNDFDLPLPKYPASVRNSADYITYTAGVSLVSIVTTTADEFQLNALHVLLDRTYVIPPTINHNLNWVLAFNINPTPGKPVRYGIFVDSNHLAPTKNCTDVAAGEDDAGAPSAPPGQQPVAVSAMYAPEYAIYVDWDGSAIVDTEYYRWSGPHSNPRCAWAAPQKLSEFNGFAWYDDASKTIELLVPYSRLTSYSNNFAGSLAVTLFSTSPTVADGIHQAVPAQGTLPGSSPNQIDNPALVSEMLLPLYPFDTPLDDPLVYQDMPAMRWRMPIFDSIDGYQVQVALDERFSQVIDEWSTWEGFTGAIFGMIPASFQSARANADNESYYWRVRLRHEQISVTDPSYDYSAWSPPIRFKLASRKVGNPRLSTGPYAFMTPTFEWDRVEGAAGYILQVDDDAAFGSPLIEVKVDGTSYTPPENSTYYALQSQTTYYWRVAMRRSDNVFGQWTDPMPFMKTSIAPMPLAPVTPPDAAELTLVAEQPTFSWTAVLTPTAPARLAAAQYRLQVDDDAGFNSPKIDVVTTGTFYTPVRGQSLADGAWYWRVAIIEATGKSGPFSPPQAFRKQYPLPVMLSPNSGSVSGDIPAFTWQATPGAAYYKFTVANNEAMQNASSTNTVGTTYTPTAAMKNGQYYWRVQMYDLDDVPGPIVAGRFNLGYSVYLPSLSKR